jgi:hypothetical protein
LARRDSALFGLNHDAVPVATPRHAQARVRTSSCETFISLITTSGRPAQRPAGRAATVAHELVGLVLANQSSAATVATLDQHLRLAGFPTIPTTAWWT